MDIDNKITNLLKNLTYHFIAICSSGLLVFIGWLIAMQYTIYDGRASWYFPVGIEIVAFIIFPMRYWIAIILGYSFASALYDYLYFEIALSNFSNIFVYGFFDRLIPLIGIIYIKLKKVELRLDKVESAVSILIAALIYRVLRFIEYYVFSNDKLYGDFQKDKLFELFMLHIVTGFVAIFITLIFIFTIKHFNQHLQRLKSNDRLQMIFQITLVLASFAALYFYNPDTLYILKMIAFIPLVWFSYRFGWLGIMLFANCLNILILFYAFNPINDDIIIDSQAYIISYSLVAILIGAVINEYNEIKEKLVSQNHNLKTLNKNIQNLSKRLVGLQEIEHKSMALTIHDEFAQNITALKIGISLVKRDSSPEQNESIDYLESSSTALNDSVYGLLNWLHPKVLYDKGLRGIIESSYFSDKLKIAEINYSFKISGDITSFPKNLNTAIYRIIQEAITNTIKHSQAKNFNLDITSKQEYIKIIISDDGNGCAANSADKIEEGEYGLAGIKERVFSLAGEITINSSSGFSMNILLPGDANKALSLSTST